MDHELIGATVKDRDGNEIGTVTKVHHGEGHAWHVLVADYGEPEVSQTSQNVTVDTSTGEAVLA